MLDLSWLLHLLSVPPTSSKFPPSSSNAMMCHFQSDHHRPLLGSTHQSFSLSIYTPQCNISSSKSKITPGWGADRSKRNGELVSGSRIYVLVVQRWLTLCAPFGMAVLFLAHWRTWSYSGTQEYLSLLMEELLKFVLVGIMTRRSARLHLLPSNDSDTPPGVTSLCPYHGHSKDDSKYEGRPRERRSHGWCENSSCNRAGTTFSST
jgi:hypothetical protein